MQFSDTTNNSGLIQDCEFNCNLGSAGISGDTSTLKNFTRLINSWYHKVETMILRAQDNWDFDDSNKTDLPILTTNLVASQQDYTLPTGTLKVKRVKVALDGTNWYWATPVDIDEATGGTTASTISASENANKPEYDIIGSSIFLYPTPTANRTSCLKIWASREPTEFTTASTTAEPGFDEAFHRMLSLGASYDYALAHSLENVVALRNEIDTYERRLTDYYKNKNKDVVSRLAPAVEDNR